jgi:superfamily I DNA/RNA helicase
MRRLLLANRARKRSREQLLLRRAAASCSSSSSSSSRSNAAIFVGLSGTGKTHRLTRDMLLEAERCSSSRGLLAVAPHWEAVQHMRDYVEVQRPLGCTKCEFSLVDGLALKIASEFGPEVGWYPPKKLSKRPEIAAFVHDILADLPLGPWRPVTNEVRAVEDLLKLFEGLAAAGYGEEKYLALAKQSGDEGHIRKASLYKYFVEAKKKAGIADKSDVLIVARDAAGASLGAREAFSSRYSSLYVDELHLLSPVAVDMVTALVGEHSVRIVTSADPYLPISPLSRRRAYSSDCPSSSPLLRFLEAFPRADTVMLTQSQRMGCPHLTSALVALAPSSALPVSVPQSGLLEAKCTAELEQRPPCVEFFVSKDGLDDELDTIAEKLKEIWPGRVAIMVQWNRVDRVASFLRAAGFPAHTPDVPLHFSASQRVQSLLCLLRFLATPSDSAALLQFLLTCPSHEGWGGDDSGELAAMLESYSRKRVPLESVLRTAASGSLDSSPDTSSHFHEVARRAVKLLSWAKRAAAGGKAAREVLLEHLRRTGQLDILLHPMNEANASDSAAIAAFFDLLVVAEERSGGSSIAQVEPVLQLLLAHRGGLFGSSQDTLSLQEHHSAGSSVETSLTVMPLSAAVTCTREFDSIFIPDLTKSSLPGRFESARFCPPDPLPQASDDFALASDHFISRRDSHHDYCRSILYAAMARATSRVVLSYSLRGIGTRGMQRASPFLVDMLGEDAIRLAESVARDTEAVSSAAVSDAEPILRQQDTLDESLTLSFSSICSYQRCPHSFYLSHVLHVSPPPSPIMTYGSAMHHGAAVIALGAREREPKAAALRAARKAFIESLARTGATFESESQRREFEERGIRGLVDFSKRHRSSDHFWVPDGVDVDLAANAQHEVHIETPFQVPVGQGVTLSGIFDRVDILREADSSLPKHLWITDLKSNVAKKDPRRMVHNNLQLQLYSLGAQSIFGLCPSHVVIESIEDGRKGVAAMNDDACSQALGVLLGVALKVRLGEYAPTPSFQACTFCGFRSACSHSAVAHLGPL